MTTLPAAPGDVLAVWTGDGPLQDLYDLPSVGWAHPDLGDERQCEPADWWSWSEARSWTSAGQ